MLMAAQGKVLRCKVGDIREIGRNTQGVRILDLDGDEDRVVAVARLADNGEREEAGSDEGAAGQ
jgi:DNA gyrase subunit A